MDKEFVARLGDEINRARLRVANQIKVVEQAAEKDLLEEQAALRSMVMSLEGLEVMLRKIEEQAFGG